MSKLFVVRKFVWAESADDAIKREKRCPVNDIWWDEDDKRKQLDVIYEAPIEGFGKKKGSR